MDKLPVFIKEGVKLTPDGVVPNLNEFESINDIFDFSKCLECIALHKEHYGSSVESPCVKCDCLVRKIKEANEQ